MNEVTQTVVMAGLVPAIHVCLFAEPKTWMPGTSPAMTSEYGGPT